MIDITAILIFSLLIVYTVFRAVKIDKLLPWFSAEAIDPASLKLKKKLE